MKISVLFLLFLIVLFCETIDAGTTYRRRKLPPIVRYRKICRRSAYPGDCVEKITITREEVVVTNDWNWAEIMFWNHFGKSATLVISVRHSYEFSCFIMVPLDWFVVQLNFGCHFSYAQYFPRTPKVSTEVLVLLLKILWFQENSLYILLAYVICISVANN